MKHNLTPFGDEDVPCWINAEEEVQVQASRALPLEVAYCHNLLVRAAWRGGGSLPNDDRAIAKLLGCELKRWVKLNRLFCRCCGSEGRTAAGATRRWRAGNVKPMTPACRHACSRGSSTDARPLHQVLAERFTYATDDLEFDVQNTYHAMLDKACMTGRGSLPRDDRAIRLLLGISPKKWGKRRHLVMPFWFVGEDGRLHNKRLDEEWAKLKGHFVDKPKKNGAVLDASREKIPTESANKERGPFGLPKGNQTPINSPAISTRARAQATDAGEDLSALKAERDLPLEAQSPSEPAAALSVGHAAQPAQNTPPTPTNGADPMPDPETNARITAAMAALKRDLAEKNLPHSNANPSRAPQPPKGLPRRSANVTPRSNASRRCTRPWPHDPCQRSASGPDLGRLAIGWDGTPAAAGWDPFSAPLPPAGRPLPWAG